MSAAVAAQEWARAPFEGIAKTPVARCPACDSPKQRPLFEVREHEYATTTSDAFPLVECEDCGAWFLNPRPATTALDVIYPPNYFLHVLEMRAGEADQRAGLFAYFQDLLFRRRIRPIEAHVALGPETRWLDIGCGTGSVLESMRKAYGATGVGIDFSERAAALARQRGFDARVGRFEDYAPDGGERYQLIHSSHVIEHLESPLHYMRKCWDLLERGGINVVITPNKDAWEAKRFGRHWGGLHVPRHWTLLGPESARTLGERTGFEHLETRFSTNGTFWGWTLHALAEARFGRSLADRVFPSDHRVVAAGLGSVLRNGLLTVFDALNQLWHRETANMLVIYRKRS